METNFKLASKLKISIDADTGSQMLAKKDYSL